MSKRNKEGEALLKSILDSAKLPPDQAEREFIEAIKAEMEKKRILRQKSTK